MTLLLADGSETGWDLGFNEISTVALDTAQRCLEGIDPRGQAAIWSPMFQAVREAVAASFPSTEDFSASATLLCIHLDHSRAQAAWIAPHEAFLVRGGTVIERTVGHSLGRVSEKSETGVASAHGAPAPISTRSIIEGQSDVEPSTLAIPWSLRSGDRIALCTAHLLQTIQTTDIGSLATTTSLEDYPAALISLAEQKAQRAFGSYDRDDPFRRHDADRFFSMLMHCAAVVVAEVV